MDVEKIIKERERKEKEIQEKYNSLNNYLEKLNYIFNLLKVSQGHFLKWQNNDFINDNYLIELSEKLKVQVTNDDEFVDFIDNYLIKKINNDHVSIGPMAYDDLDDLRTTNNQYDEHEIREEFKNSNINVSFLDNTVIISIHSFSNTRIEKDRYIFENLEHFLEQNSIDNIIIDIRGNGGGSDSYFKLFSIFTDQDLPFNDCLYDLFLKKRLDFTWNVVPSNNKSRHYNKYLLTDNKVFSTAETLAKFCKQTGYATIIGEATLGDGGGFTPFNIKLTNGVYNGDKKDFYKNEWKIIGKDMGLWFPTEAPLNKNGQIEYEGLFNTTPDIECLGDEALDVAMNIITSSKRL